jgi:putative transposase
MGARQMAEAQSIWLQLGYGAFSISKSNVPEVLKYIANQEAHHRKLSFKEELIEFLKKHEIDYDERYLWL